MILGDCKSCRYKFRRKTLSNSLQTIDLVDTKENKTVGRVRFVDEPDKITIEYLGETERKGHTLRLLRSLQCIAKRRKKTIIAESVASQVRFFKDYGFRFVKREKGLFMMEWKPLNA